MLDKMIDPEVELALPGERQLLHLESILGGDPDATRVGSIAQLHSSMLVQHGSPAPPPPADDNMMGLD